MRLYTELAEWWPLLDDPADYAEEAGIYGDLLAEACDGRIESLLELDGGRKRRTGMKAAPGGPRGSRRTARAEPEGDEAAAIAASSRGPDGAG